MSNESENVEYVIRQIFKTHGDDAVYITNTGYNSRLVHNMFPDKKNIFYMQGSMGLSPAIALGVAKNSRKDVVALVGDGSFLMHMGITHTIRSEGLSNIYVYVLDNGCHESVGEYPCVELEDSYPGVTKVFRVNTSGKFDRVKISFEDNATNIRSFLSGTDLTESRANKYESNH